MNAIAMIALLTVALGAFAYTAQRRWRLLLVGGPAPRFDRLFERMATAPGARAPSVPGLALVVAIFALPVVALGLALAGWMTDGSDVARFVQFNAVGALAT